MIWNYLRLAWRNILKNKVSSFINITGLTVGITCCLLIGLYIRHELSYDRFHEKGDRIARVIMEYSIGGTGNAGNFTSTKVLPAFQQNFPEVETGVRMSFGPRLVKKGTEVYSERRFLFADSTIFSVFSFPLIKGSPTTVLNRPNTVVISESTANKYFGSENPVGKTIKTGSTELEMEITGVMKDCPSNSQLKFDLVASFSSIGPAQTSSYFNANYTTYFLLKDEASIAGLQQKIPAFMKKELEGKPETINYFLEPLTSVHLHSAYEGMEPNNSITYIYILAGIAVLILAIACFTYVNLSTARSMERAREVGIRKVSGARKEQLFWQFIGDSTVTATISAIFSVALAVLVLPYFNHLSDRSFTSSQVFDPVLMAGTIALVLVVSLLAGSYPAVVLSAFNPVTVLKGAFKNTGSGIWLRKSLTVFQFVISVFLIIATFTIQGQLQYIRSKNIGYDRDQVLVLPSDPKIMKAADVLRSEFSSQPGIKSVSLTYDAPNHIRGGYAMRNNEMTSSQSIAVTANPVDQDFLPATGIQLIAGSNINKQDVAAVNREGDTTTPEFQYVINESAAAALGWKPQEAIGKRMFLGDDRPGFVKGVVKDFHFESLHHAIRPLVMFPGNYSRVMMIKLKTANLPATIAAIETTWKKLVPHRPFDYHFLDEDFNKMYSTELRTGEILNLFAGIAIFLACLGLFGLSSYAAQQRIKEIGIRKVLGASVLHLTTILSKDFVKLALVAFVLAAPLAWWVMNGWLSDFSYRISMSWQIFVVAGFVCLSIAVLTVSIQAIKVAMGNPIKNLRTE